MRKFISDTAYQVGGDMSDEVKKELDMWEVPFTEPGEDESEADVKAR